MKRSASVEPHETAKSGGTQADALGRFAAKVRNCRLCDLGHEPRPVFQAGVRARICIAGQAPGTLVHETGIPFNDPSGDRLRTWLGVERAQFYDPANFAILPMGFCFPGQDAKGGDLPPRPECAPAWREPLLAHLPNIELTLLVGLYAQHWYLGRTRQKNLTETVRAWRTYLPRQLPLPHPSWRNNHWLRKNPWFEAQVLPYLKATIRELVLS